MRLGNKMPEHNLTQSGWNVKYNSQLIKKFAEELCSHLEEKEAWFQLKIMAFFVLSACIYNVKMVHYNGFSQSYVRRKNERCFGCFVIKFPLRNGC